MAACGSMKKSDREERRRKLSEKAIAFYAQHNVTDTVEKLLNQLYVAAPSDVYGYMVRHIIVLGNFQKILQADYLSNLAVPPVISRGKCHESVDERGDRAIDVSIYCTVRGSDKFVASVSVPVNSRPPPPPAPVPTTSPASKKKKGVSKTQDAGVTESTSEAGKREKEDAAFALESFKSYIAPTLASLSPRQQQEIDSNISGLTNKEGKELHPSALLATSLALAKTAAQLSNHPLHDYLISVFSPPPSSSSSSSSSLSLPTQVTSLLAGGCGKLKVSEFCILPLPGRTLSEQVLLLGSVYRSMGTLLTATKSGTPVIGQSGAYMPLLDKLEVGVDLVREAVALSGLTLGQDVSAMIDIGADRLFDEQKQKYELVTGQWKSSEELISIYTALLDAQPGVVGFIEPLHHMDIRGWRVLQEALGGRCLLVASEKMVDSIKTQEEGGGGEGEHEEGTAELQFSCASLTLERTVSATWSKHSYLSERVRYTMLSSPSALTSSPHLIDLAVAMKCEMVRLNAACGVTSSCLLTRLLEIRDELSSKGTYKPAKALLFSSVI